MKKYHKITPEGTRDLMFEQCQMRRTVEATLRNVFQGLGYQEVMTPGFEFYDVFGAASQYFPQESMYKLIDHKGRLMVVRPDSTIPIARLVATKLQEYPMPIRLYYNQNIFRLGPTMDGGSHEMMQMGIELIGAGQGKSDLEILATCGLCFDQCGVSNYRLELGHVAIFKTLLQRLEATAEQKDAIATYVESKNYSALHDLLEAVGPSQEAVLLNQLPRWFGSAEVLQQVKQLLGDYDGQLQQMVIEVEEIYQQLSAMGMEEAVLIDFGLVNQWDYYSGLSFRGYIQGIGMAVLSGGRYDHLMEDFGSAAPAIGMGIQVDLLAQAVADQRLSQDTREKQLVYCQPQYVPQALAYVVQRVAQGVQCQFSLQESLQQAMAYAKENQFDQLICYGHQVEVLEVTT